MKSYDEKEESIYIKYLDANNLYGWVDELRNLPTGDFKWMNQSLKLEELERQYPCILEVDLRVSRRAT